MLKLKLQYFDYLMWTADSLEKTLMLGKIEVRRRGRQRIKMVGWHHRLNGHEFEQILGDDEGEGSLVCCSPRGCKQSDTMKWLNNKDNNSAHFFASWWFNICLHIIELKNLDDFLLLWQLEPSLILLGRKKPRVNVYISILPLAGRLLYTGVEDSGLLFFASWAVWNCLREWGDPEKKLWMCSLSWARSV